MRMFSSIKISFFTITEAGFTGHFTIREVVDIIAVGTWNQKPWGFGEGVSTFGGGVVEWRLTNVIGVDAGKKL